MGLIERYDYPGNVRELENAIEHAVAISDGRVISAADLPSSIRSPRLLPTTGVEAGAGQSPGQAAGLQTGSTPLGQGSRESWSLADVEKEHIQLVLARHHSNATTAAKQLGISRTTLWRKLREYGLKRTGP
jgi:DNA-binding NtrC family response regulator